MFLKKLKNKNIKKNNFIDGEFEDIDDENDRKIEILGKYIKTYLVKLQMLKLIYL